MLPYHRLSIRSLQVSPMHKIFSCHAGCPVVVVPTVLAVPFALVFAAVGIWHSLRFGTVGISYFSGLVAS